jgi:hypothetical protein
MLPTGSFEGPKMKDAIDLYAVYRDYAKHEDDLINHRLSWNLAVQSMMFTAYGVSVGLLKSDRQPVVPFLRGARQLLTLFPLIGGAAGSLVLISVVAAVLALRRLDGKWRQIPVEHKDRLPDLTGGGNRLATVMGHFAQIGIPLGVVVAWLYIFQNIPM